MLNVTINLYAFSELSERAQQKAISDHRVFLINTMEENDFIFGDPVYDTPEKLKEAYEAEFDYYLMHDEPIIESIEINEYLFYSDGSICWTCHYCGPHPLAGQTEVKIHGESYFIQEEK